VNLGSLVLVRCEVMGVLEKAIRGLWRGVCWCVELEGCGWDSSGGGWVCGVGGVGEPLQGVGGTKRLCGKKSASKGVCANGGSSQGGSGEVRPDKLLHEGGTLRSARECISLGRF